MRRIRHLVFAVGAAATLMWAAAGSTVAADQTVEIDDLAYSPPTVTVEVGETVIWVNGDDIAHTATDTDGSFDTEEIAPGTSVSVLFDTVGTSDYACTIHPQMTGTVVVQAAGAAPTTGEPAATMSATDTLADLTTDSDTGATILGIILVTLVLAVTLLPARRLKRKPR
jgi:plastocyanin